MSLLLAAVCNVTQADASIDRSFSDAVNVAAATIGIVLNGLAFVITAAKTAIQVQRVSSIGLGTTLSVILLRDGELITSDVALLSGVVYAL